MYYKVKTKSQHYNNVVMPEVIFRVKHALEILKFLIQKKSSGLDKIPAIEQKLHSLHASTQY